MYTDTKGDLIALAKEGQFDVIAHGCNCFCTMKRGIAPQMAEAFGCDKFPMENLATSGDINKLGQIDCMSRYLSLVPQKLLTIVNCYTQYHWGTETKPFDYIAFTLCMRKMNRLFKQQSIGLPQIGAGLAGGNWNLISPIIEAELSDCKVTVVVYEPKTSTNGD